MVSSRKERPKKRDLIRWDEDKDIQILLAVVHHCNQKGVKIPWDDVGREIGSTVTGNAVMQHIAKLRKKRETQGLQTPTKRQKRAQRASAAKRKKNSSDDSDDDDQEEADSDASYGATHSSKRLSARRVQNFADVKATLAAKLKDLSQDNRDANATIKEEPDETAKSSGQNVPILERDSSDSEEESKGELLEENAPVTTPSRTHLQSEDRVRKKSKTITFQIQNIEFLRGLQDSQDIEIDPPQQNLGEELQSQQFGNVAPNFFYGYPSHVIPQQLHNPVGAELPQSRTLPPISPFGYQVGVADHVPGSFPYGMQMGGMHQGFATGPWPATLQYPGSMGSSIYSPHAFQAAPGARPTVEEMRFFNNGASRRLENPFPTVIHSPRPPILPVSNRKKEQELQDLNEQDNAMSEGAEAGESVGSDSGSEPMFQAMEE